MEFNILAGLVAGFIGTIAMTALMRASTSAGMTNMPPMPLIQGAMATDDPEKAKKVGMVMHVILTGTIVFGIAYAAIFSALGSAGWLTGLVVGLVHGVVAGLFMKMMGSTHPKMEAVSNFAGDTTWTHDANGIHIAEPGLFGKNYRAMTPVGLLIGHAMFGVVVGLVYKAIV